MSSSPSLWPTAATGSSHPMSRLPLSAWRPQRAAVSRTTQVDEPASAVIDAHNHLGRWLTGEWSVPDPSLMLDVLDRAGVELVVNLDGRWGEELEANLERYDRRWPDRVATFAHLDWSLLSDPSAARSATRLAQGLQRSADQGARGVKIWKDLGLHVRDHRESLVLLDDPRLDEAFELMGELGLPAFVHSADPVAFFDPVDERNERLEQLLAYPEWSYADRDRFPSFERLMEALEARVARHPRTQVVGVHFGCFAEDPAEVGRMLDTYPNYHVDIAARTAELGRQPRAVAAVVERHPHRVLFGTDAFPPELGVYRDHYRFLETADECFDHDEAPSPMGRWTISALDLSPATLARVYAGNARALLDRTDPSPSIGRSRGGDA